MLKKIIIVTILLCSIDLYSLDILPEGMRQLVGVAGIGLILVYLLLLIVYDDSPWQKPRFGLPIVIFFVAMIISMFGAYMFHNQDFVSTLWGQRALYYYFFYFLLLKSKPEYKFITWTIFLLGTLFIIIYIVQTLIYPHTILNCTMRIDRNTLRIYMPGTGLMQMAYFLALYRFFQDYRKRYLIYILGTLIVLVLLGSRQSMAAIALITMMFLVFNRVVKLKAVIIPLMVLSVIPIFFLFQDVFTSMLEVSNRQGANVEENIRIRAIKFFMTDFYNNRGAYFIGHGDANSNSMYGLKLLRYNLQYGFYLSDIGIIGDLVLYGPLFIVGIFVFIWRLFRSRLRGEAVAVKYFFAGVVMMMFTGSSPFSVSSGIGVMTFLLYFIEIRRDLPDPES